jgi:hypothetical protein
MLTQHIALVPEVVGINASELARVSAALQKQIIRDLSPIWQIAATVDAFPHLEDVPVGYWPIILAFGELGTDEGVHCDRKGQPYALIEMSPSWSLTASHGARERIEQLEGLLHGRGNRRQWAEDSHGSDRAVLGQQKGGPLYVGVGPHAAWVFGPGVGDPARSSALLTRRTGFG